jgi:SAM-dependent methyltransferase
MDPCIYDHPLYYDILFGWDRTKEAAFYADSFARGGVDPRAGILEVACGTGRVALLLAERGWSVTGLDCRPAMLDFLRDRAADVGVAIGTLLGDMASFETSRRFAAAYNPMSSYRLLADDASACAHLRATAAALVPGGLYVLDLDFAADAAAPAITTDESWEMERGAVTVRADDDAVRVRDDGRELTLAWGSAGHLRPTTVACFRAQVASSGAFAIESWHPERTRATGVSEFRSHPAAEPPEAGRAMVILRRP